MTDAPALAAAGSADALFKLMAWLSPSYPVGAFSYSSGLEWAVEAGDVTDAGSLAEWVVAMLRDGPGGCDAVLFAHAHLAMRHRDRAAWDEVTELAAALAGTRERFLETTAQGRAFASTTQAVWPARCDSADAFDADPLAYPVAVATAAALHDIPIEAALHAYLHAYAANLISAGVRLVPLGQTDGQRVLARMLPVIEATASRALATPLDELGACTLRADIASMRHETQYTRLFRS